MHPGCIIFKTVLPIFKRTPVSGSNLVFLGCVSGLRKSDEPIFRYSAGPVGYLLAFTLSSQEGARIQIIYMKKGIAVDSLVFYRHPCVISFTGSTRSPRLATSSSTCDPAFLTVGLTLVLLSSSHPMTLQPTCIIQPRSYLK